MQAHFRLAYQLCVHYTLCASGAGRAAGPITPVVLYNIIIRKGREQTSGREGKKNNKIKEFQLKTSPFPRSAVQNTWKLIIHTHTHTTLMI